MNGQSVKQLGKDLRQQLPRVKNYKYPTSVCIYMHIKTLQIKLDEQTFRAFERVKKKWKSKNWNDFVDKLILKER